MRIRNRWLLDVLALVGIAACATAFFRFVRTISRNGLPWSPDLGAREFYLEIGHAYGKGFVVGFFFSFFLVVLALAVSSRMERFHRRAPARLQPTREPLPRVEP